MGLVRLAICTPHSNGTMLSNGAYVNGVFWHTPENYFDPLNTHKPQRTVAVVYGVRFHCGAVAGGHVEADGATAMICARLQTAT